MRILLFFLTLSPLVLFSKGIYIGNFVTVIDQGIFEDDSGVHIKGSVKNNKGMDFENLSLTLKWTTEEKKVTSKKYEIAEIIKANESIEFVLDIPESRKDLLYTIKGNVSVVLFGTPGEIATKGSLEVPKDDMRKKRAKEAYAKIQAKLNDDARARIEARNQTTKRNPIKILGWRWYQEGEYVYVVGEVKNNSRNSLKYVKIVASFYKYNDRFLQSEYTYTELSVIPPGGVSPFEIMEKYDERMDSVKISYQCRVVE